MIGSMPKILERLVGQLQAKGKSKSSAYAIATASLQKAGDLKKGSQKPTPKGARRGNMTPEERSNNRAAKYSGKSSSSFKYNAKTNRSKLK